jgi:hypothetical protein
MEENKEQPKKLSYEELEQVAKQLSNQSEMLYMKLQEANMTNAYKRLDYLFKVLENEVSFKEDFVEKCAKEIVEIMTIPEEETKEEK